MLKGESPAELILTRLMNTVQDEDDADRGGFVVEAEHVTDLPEPAGQAPTESTPPAPKGSTALESPAVVTKLHQSLDQLIDDARIQAVTAHPDEVAAFQAAVASYRATVAEWSAVPVGNADHNELLAKISGASTPKELFEAQLALAASEAGGEQRGRSAARLAIERGTLKAAQPAVQAAITLLNALSTHTDRAYESARVDERNAFDKLFTVADTTEHSQRYVELKKRLDEVRGTVTFTRQDGTPWPTFDSLEVFVKIPVEPAAKPIGILAKAKRLVSRK